MSVEETRTVMEAYWAGQGVETIAEDAVYTLMVSGEQHHGREAIFQLLESFYNQAFDGEFEETNTIIADGNAVAEGYLAGKHTGEFAGIPPTGKDVRVPLCIVYDVSAGQIQHARIYFQMATLNQQLGR